jgi:hypothetical protein
MSRVDDNRIQMRVALFRIAHDSPGTPGHSHPFACSYSEEITGCVRVSEWVEVDFPLLGELDLSRARALFKELDANVAAMIQRRDLCAARIRAIEEATANGSG